MRIKDIEKKLFLFIKKKNNKIKNSDYNKNFIENNLLDSIGFLELILYIEKNYSIKIDFGDLDPSEYTSINKFSKFISESKS